MPTIVRALSAAAHPCGMRPPSGASPRLCHWRDCRQPASTPGRASWDGDLTQSNLRSPSSSPASSSRAGLYAGRAVSGSPESGLQIRAREPHSLRFQECPREGVPRERDSRLRTGNRDQCQWKSDVARRNESRNYSFRSRGITDIGRHRSWMAWSRFEPLRKCRGASQRSSRAGHHPFELRLRRGCGRNAGSECLLHETRIDATGCAYRYDLSKRCPLAPLLLE